MRDNFFLILLGASLAGGTLYEANQSEYTPTTAVWYQEGRLASEPAPQPAKDPVTELLTDPGPISHIVDTHGTGPPPQDDFPRSPDEIRRVLAEERNFGYLQP